MAFRLLPSLRVLEAVRPLPTSLEFYVTFTLSYGSYYISVNYTKYTHVVHDLFTPVSIVNRPVLFPTLHGVKRKRLTFCNVLTADCILSL